MVSHNYDGDMLTDEIAQVREQVTIHSFRLRVPRAGMSTDPRIPPNQGMRFMGP